MNSYQKKKREKEKGNFIYHEGDGNENVKKAISLD